MTVNGATRFSSSGFFYESVSPKPLSILLRPFQIFFSAIRGVFAAQGTPVANQNNFLSEIFFKNIFEY
jgi:hypothetical protein